jgi:hypothetical protein
MYECIRICVFFFCTKCNVSKPKYIYIESFIVISYYLNRFSINYIIFEVFENFRNLLAQMSKFGKFKMFFLEFLET